MVYRVSEKQFLKNEDIDEQKFCSSVGFFCKHSCRDIKRRKCHFCLAFCSVFIVVISTLVINTVVEKGPIIFLKMAEGTQGEIDAYVNPAGGELDKEFLSKYSVFINYTRVIELYNTEFNLSPRKNFIGVEIMSDAILKKI